jgi:hypothetical protein
VNRRDHGLTIREYTPLALHGAVVCYSHESVDSGDLVKQLMHAEHVLASDRFCSNSGKRKIAFWVLANLP